MKHIVFYILSVTLAMVACNDDSNLRNHLKHADTLLLTKPDSALTLLADIKCDNAGKDIQAWHALLTAKAYEKSYRRFLNDSLTAMAAECFRERGDSLEVQSLYYNGVINGYNKKYAEALISLIEAVEKAHQTSDNFYIAMAYREQADIYRSLFVKSKHLEYADSAQRYFYLAGKPIYAIREKLSLAEALISLKREDSAIEVLASLRKEPEFANAPAFNASYHRSMAEAYTLKQDLASALNHLDSIAYFTNGLTSVELSKKSRLLCGLNDFEAASHALDEARIFMFELADSAEFKLSEATLYADWHDYRRAYEAFKRHYNNYVTPREILLTHPYTSIINDHYKQQLDNRKNELHTAHLKIIMLLTIAIIIILLAVLIISIYRHRFKEKTNQSKILIDDIERLQKIIDTNRGHSFVIKEKDLAVKKDSPHNYSILNSLFELSNMIPDNADGYTLLGKKVSKLITSFQDDRTMNSIEEFVNDRYDGLMAKFRLQYPTMTERNYRLVMLSYAGFSTQSITCILQLKSDGATRTMRHRIKKHLEEHPSPDSDIFIAHL